MVTNVAEKPPLDLIPEPMTIRQWIGRLIRQLRILRRLLRISEAAARERSGSKEVRFEP